MMAMNANDGPSRHPSEDSFPTPQRFPLSSIPPSERDAFDDATMQTETETAFLPAVMLRKYLRHSALPACLRFGQIPVGTTPKFITPWPEHSEMKRPEGSRVLEDVETYDKWNFSRSVRSYIDTLPAHHFGTKEASRLRLPSDGFAELDEDDIERYSYIDGVDQLLATIEEDVLKTVCECIRVIERMPVDAPLFNDMQFHRASHLCTAHNARWDILAMCPNLFEAIPIVVIVVPPWEFSLKAFKRFTWARNFPANILDSLPVNPADSTSDKLWAVIHDVCYEQCKFFVVTNYTHWAFGRFTNNGKLAMITEPVEARTVGLGGGVNVAVDAGANVPESLVYWVQVSRNAAPPVMQTRRN
ncbi:hypothetical protein E1B28_007758 [Marasmius oreades]|uniref:Uncharacterized protein n=1 Tax=Marasmius oreades TaxID=181124 RepID=A0A9P7S3P6_9AGAR|nr:uncharacterized protein E1B28_007758 [Marasmius oreades]KAG7094146.1 hypothetical protein E1B28_007758 [Marasmius oreades]